MESSNYSRFTEFLSKIIGRIACRFNDHSYTWKLQRGETIKLNGNPPERAVCKYCKKTFKELGE